MISSMTGYGRADGDISLGHVVVEIKSVNHRFLDSRIRLPRSLSFLEPLVLTHLKSCLARGRVEINTSVTTVGDTTAGPVLNVPLARQYRDAADQAASELELDQSVSLDLILRMPEVLQVTETGGDPEELWEEIRPIFEQAIASLEKMRTIEGTSLAADFRKTLTELEACRSQLEKVKGFVVDEYRERLQTRLANLLSDNGGLDPTRLHQEVALFADRSDISEEIARLDSHFKQFHSILDIPEPAGRRLDFLLQEMFREINTIGSKANNLEITQVVLEMKNLIERLREQAQNVE